MDIQEKKQSSCELLITLEGIQLVGLRITISLKRVKKENGECETILVLGSFL